MSKFDSFLALDRIEEENPEVTLGGAAFLEMQAVAQDVEGLRALLMRYGSSRAAEIVSNLALVFSWFSGRSTTEQTAELTIGFIRLAGFSSRCSVVHCCLEALKLHLIGDCVWRRSASADDVFKKFLMHAFEIRCPEPFTTQAAVHLTSLLLEKSLLYAVLDQNGLVALRQKLRELTFQPDSVYEDELQQVLLSLNDSV